MQAERYLGEAFRVFHAQPLLRAQLGGQRLKALILVLDQLGVLDAVRPAVVVDGAKSKGEHEGDEPWKPVLSCQPKCVSHEPMLPERRPAVQPLCATGAQGAHPKALDNVDQITLLL